jgi:transcriptional regulator with XRE-family HTH domain
LKSSIATAFGHVARELRLSKGMTQEEVGLKADLQRNYISLLELGAKTPSLATILQIAAALDVDAGKLVSLVCERIQENETHV